MGTNKQEEQNLETSNVDTEVQTSTTPPEAHTPSGAVVGIIIIVVLLILGGLYFWGTQLFDEAEETGPSAEEIRNAEDPVTENLDTQSSSDEVVDIEQDLEASNFNSIDADLENIDAELAS